MGKLKRKRYWTGNNDIKDNENKTHAHTLTLTYTNKSSIPLNYILAKSAIKHELRL